MIEILTPGKEPKKVERRYRVRCDCCRCLFTCSGEDISSSRNPFEDTSIVACPECHTPIKFSRRSSQVMIEVE